MANMWLTSVAMSVSLVAGTTRAQTDFYWVGGNNGNWSEAFRWSATSGGGGGAGVPGPADTVIFDSGGSGRNQTVTGSPTFDNRAALVSTHPGTPWMLTVPGTPVVDQQPVGRVSVRDSDASGGMTFQAAVGSSDLGGNANWEFLQPAGSLILMR